MPRTLVRASKRKKSPEFGFHFEYNEKGNFYYVSANRELIGEVITDDIKSLTYYMTKEYDKIFPDYNAQIHSVELVTNYGMEMYPTAEEFVYKVYESTKEHICDLPFGIYQLHMHNDYGLIFKKHSLLNVDQYIDLGRSVGDLKENFSKFRGLREKIAEAPVKIRHKQGTLLYGPPGTGKTREIIRLFETEKDLDFYTFIVPKTVAIHELNSLRELFSKRDADIVFVLEEITERTTYGTDDLLTFLDGEFSWEHAYIIATTNYPDQLASNIIDRPGRFEKYIHMDVPTKDQIKTFMSAFKVSDEDIERTIRKYFERDLSLDYYRYIAIQNTLMERKLDDIFDELENTRSRIKTSIKGRMGL